MTSESEFPPFSEICLFWTISLNPEYDVFLVSVISVIGERQHFLPLIIHRPCYSYSKYVLDITIYKQT